MELTLERYLQDEGLREEMDRRAHRERADAVHEFLARAAQAALADRADAEDACHSYASR